MQGNMGGGFTHLVMPVIFDGIKMSTPAFQAWRWAFFVPGAFQLVLMAATLLLAQDLPGGNFAALKKSGAMVKPKGAGVWKAAVFNYR
jgi:NNP family nitrate/nitrite transporter-like MFS transporter